MNIATCAGLLALLTAAGDPAGGVTTPRGVVLAAAPAVPDSTARYVIYLHGAIIESEGRRPTHPTFGTYEYDAILAALAGEGLQVISVRRPPRTDPRTYAQVVADQVDSLRTGGVAPERITVMGFSKGAAIAILASALIDEPRLNYVFMAGCADWITRPDLPVVAGRILSIHEASDDIGHSCGPLLAGAAPGSVTEEIEIDTGLKHGAFYAVRPKWFGPATAWCRGPRP